MRFSGLADIAVYAVLMQRRPIVQAGRMRQRVLKENPDLPAKAQEALFTTTMLFERIVWLARRSTMLLAS